MPALVMNSSIVTYNQFKTNTIQLSIAVIVNFYFVDSLGLHRVENPSHTEPAVSLHLYCPPFEQCGVFNQQTGQRTTCKMTFWSQYGERRNKVITEFILEKFILIFMAL